jgi:23S rRNA pseudouridine1911/1915/1917 synthase
MSNRTFEIFSNSRENIRIDHFIASEQNDFSRSKIKEAILRGCLTLDGKEVNDPSAKKQIGLYKLEVANNSQSELTPKNIALDIVYEDDDLIVINKQAGLTVHPGAGNYDDTLVNALLYRFGGNLSSVNGEDKPGIVHRLDRDTTGLMVVAKNDFSHMKLSEQLQDRTLSRQYYALCYGTPELGKGRIETYLDRSRADRTKMKVTKASGRIARTEYEVIDSFYDGMISLIKCKLHTGRTHQIRVHLTHIGYPIVGDRAYGKRPHNLEKILVPEVFDAIHSLNRQALHSFYIEFTHPRLMEKLCFEISLHEALLKIIEAK